LTQRETTRPTFPVGDLLAQPPPGLGLRLCAGSAGLQRAITSPGVERPGLTLTGPLDAIRPGTVQVLGRSEVTYVAHLSDGPRRALAERLCGLPLACLVVTHGAPPHPDLASAADRAALPLFATPRPTTETMDVLRRHLEERLAPSVTVHGTLMDIYGVGVLILGESGIGKSESALELVLRGHRLVSDDTVTVRRIGGLLNGMAPELSRYHIELRGLGILNIKDLFGVASVRERKDVDLIVQLDRWQEDKQYDRLGLDEKVYQLLGLEVPFLEMPVGPGRSLSVLLEVAARHHLLKRRGYHAAKELAGRIHEALGRKS